MRRRRRLLLAAAGVLGAVAGTVPAGARAPDAPSGPAGLPPGWELCVLQGLKAPVTSANVADLDEWQLAEGGSTANDVAYNPFNSRRATDQADAALPATFTATGFPAFATWAAGCAATVGTLLQPNMAPIAAALVAGDVSPPGAFLAVVDQTPWCAPTDGVPCYMGLIWGPAVQTASTAMGLYQSTSASLAAYDGDVRAASAIEATLAGARQRLAVDDVEVALARFGEASALATLRQTAVYEYTSNPALDQMANLLYFQAPSSRDLLGQVYRGVDVRNLVGRYQAARAALASAQGDRQGAADEVTRTTAALASARAAVGQALAVADLQLVSLQAAGACDGGTGTSPPAAGDAAQLSALRSCLSALGA